MTTLFFLSGVIILLFLPFPYKAHAQRRTALPVKTGTTRPAFTPEVSWQKTSFPSEVDTFTAHLTINSSGHIFVGTANGVYRSMDGGTTWTQINNGLKYDSYGKLNIFALAINPTGHIFAAIHDELYRSTDDGNNWTKIRSGLTAMAMAVNSSGHIFVGDQGMLRSTDEGVTWTKINNGFDSNVVNSIVMNSNGDVFVGAYDGVYRSTDNGDHWKHILDFGGGNNAGNLAINSSGNIFVGMNSNARMDQGTEGVYRSTNNGDRWTRIIKNGGPQIPNFDGAWSIVIDSKGIIFLGTRSGVYRSNNSGISWTKISKGLVLSKDNLTDKNVSALAIDPNGIMFAVTPAGVYRAK